MPFKKRKPEIYVDQIAELYNLSNFLAGYFRSRLKAGSSNYWIYKNVTLKTRSGIDLTKDLDMEDFTINIKLKLAAFWISATFCFLYGDYFELYTPGKVSSLISGENVLNSPVTLFIASLIMVIPPLMIVFSLILKPRVNKWLNIAIGSLFTLMMVLIALGSLTPWYSFYVLLAIVESVLTGAVVWNAIKWPKVNI